jgi:hypothetical protein
MRKLLLIGVIAAAPMLVAPNTASAWGCGYGYGYAPRYFGYSAPRYSYGYTAPRYYGYSYPQMGMGRKAPLVAGVPQPCVLLNVGPRGIPRDAGADLLRQQHSSRRRP